MAAQRAGADPLVHVAVTVLVSSVTAPLRASARPSRLAPVVIVMLVNARMFPPNAVAVPMVAELPTCQKTLQMEAPLTTTTDEPLAVVKVLPILNTNTAFAVPWAS